MEKLYNLYKNTIITKELKVKSKTFTFKFNISLWIKLFIVLIAMAAFFVGALDFQAAIVGIGTPIKGGPALVKISSVLVYPGIIISLLFGTLSLVAFGLVNSVEKKFGKEKATLMILTLFVITLVALAGMIIGAVAYVNK